MKSVTILLCVLLMFTILIGCEDVDLSQVSDEDLERISDKAVVCNDPYIRLGTGCCLDQNANNICDNDEIEALPEEPPVTPPEVPPAEAELLKCSLPSGMACLDATWDATNGITVVIQNSAGFDMIAVDVAVNGTGCDTSFSYVNGSSTTGNADATTLTDGETKKYNSEQNCITLRGLYDGVLSVTYTNFETGIEKKKEGTISLKIW